MPKDQTDLGPQLPNQQTCGKCGAEFAWEPSDPMRKASPLVARCSKSSSKCDCGYGQSVHKKRTAQRR